MPLSCGLRSLLRRRRDGTESERQPGRARTWSIFGNSNPHSREHMGRLVRATAFPSPRVRGGRRPAMPQDTSTASTAFRNPFGSTSEYSDEIHNAIDAVYNELCDGDQVLSGEKFVKFLREVQGEIAVPADQAAQSLGEFRYAWAHLYSRALKSPKNKDLTKPLTNYFINSSHNTYLVGNQIVSTSNAELYGTVLRAGCRCIEIDVWNGDAVVPTSGSKTNKADHQRGLSGSSLPYMATAVFDTVDDIGESVKNYMGDKSASHSRTPSTTSRMGNGDESPRSSAMFTAATTESLEKIDTSATRLTRPRSRSQVLKGEPIVTHGWTFTAPCGFRDVCIAVRESAFVENDLPIIVSLEVHADTEQQNTMVRIMKEVWGDMLVDKKLEGWDSTFRLPPLDQLRKKILVKVKKAPVKMAAMHANTINIPVSSSLLDDTSDSEDDEKAPFMPQKTPSEPVNGTKPRAKPENLGPAFPICQALGDLAVYTRSEKFRSSEQLIHKSPPHIFSISETRILKLSETHHSEMFTHNKGFFMRAYPAGHRVDSSNPDPSPFWRRGVQMVAMNWQNLDEGMMLNEGMFADEKGWVLKPPGYLSSDKTSQTQHEAAPGQTMDLTITVFAGQRIPLESEDKETGGASTNDLRPVVKVELHVEKAEKQKKDGQLQTSNFKQSTDAGKTNHPEWGAKGKGTELRFHNVSKVVPELSFIRIKVEDEGSWMSSKLVAWACIRLDRLREGYRLIDLKDKKGKRIEGGKLLVKIDKKFR